MAIKGFKGFDIRMKCRNKQYTLGELALHDGPIEICQSGLHFCLDLANVFTYYSSGIYCEVSIPEDTTVITVGDKSVTDKLTPSKLLDGKYESLGNTYYFKQGLLHSDNDQPARIGAHLSQYWYKQGKLHRDGDLPAVISAYGSKEWYKEGKLHRDTDNPAVITADGSAKWYKEGKIQIPEFVRKHISKLKSTSNLYEQFFDERCNISENNKMIFSPLMLSQTDRH
jgi:hypothetical protein